MENEGAYAGWPEKIGFEGRGPGVGGRGLHFTPKFITPFF